MLSYTVKTRKLATPIKSLVGFADVTIDGKMEIKDFKVFQADNGDLFVKAPSQPSKKPDENGKTQYFDTVRFVDTKDSEDDKQTPFQKEMFAEIVKAFRAAGGSTRAAGSTDGGDPSAKPATKKRNPLAW